LNELSLPDFVVVGHVCQDLLPDGRFAIGGSVSYAATTALRMGCRVGVITSTGPDLDLAHTLPGVQIVNHAAAATTVFENIYENGSRKQILHRRAEVIHAHHVPSLWRQARMVYLGSIDREIDGSVFQCFSDRSILCVMPQGFFRTWNGAGRISFVEWDPPADILRRINVLVFSELDVPAPIDWVRRWESHVETIVVTRAERGATVYRAGTSCHYPARPARQVDPTGAGDVFAAAYLICLAETGEHSESARFANATASFSIEIPGIDGIPERHQVQSYLNAEAAAR